MTKSKDMGHDAFAAALGQPELDREVKLSEEIIGYTNATIALIGGMNFPFGSLQPVMVTNAMLKHGPGGAARANLRAAGVKGASASLAT